MVDWARRHLAVGGCDLINFEMKLLTAKGYSFTTTAERGNFVFFACRANLPFYTLHSIQFRDCSRYYAKVGLYRTLF